MAILYGEIDKDTKREKIHYNRGDMVASQTINDIQDTAIDAHNMATEALDKADSVFQGNGTVVSVGGREVGTLAFSSDPQQQLDTLNAKITTSSSFNAEIVDQLPTTNISTSTFYLLKNSTSADDNTYSEYLYVNGKWELLGNTQVQAYDDSELRELINGLSTTKANKTDLANYYTKDQTYNITEVDAKVINLVSTSYLKSELNPIKTDVNTNKTNIATLQTDIVGKADKSDLNNYTKTSDLAKVATSNDYNDLDNTPNTDLMVDIINEHSDSINEINAELAGKANKSEIPSISGLASETYVNTQVNTLQGKIDAKADKADLIDYATNEDLNKVAEDILDDIPDISGLASENYVQGVASVIHERIDGKQDKITDLETIRSGAGLGATAVQPSKLDGYYTKAQTENRLNAEVSVINNHIEAFDGRITTNTNSILDLIDTVGGKVSKTTTINSKPLSGNITLTASDVGALPSTTTLFSGNYNDLTNKPTIPTTAGQVGALPDTTKYGATLSLTMNTSTYVVTAQLKDQAGNNLGTAQTIDLPLESVVVSGSYNATNKKVILTLKDGSTIDFSVADLVSGLASQSYVDDTFVTNTVFEDVMTVVENVLDSTYEKPSSGIPKTDLASNVQTSLGKADTALQSIPAEYVTETELNGKGYATTSAMNSAISSAVSTKANQSEVTEISNTLTSVSNTATSNSNKISELTSTVSSNYSDLLVRVVDNDKDITNLQNNKADTTYVDGEIDRVEGLITEAGGTKVTIGGSTTSPVDTLNFDSDPQTQINTLSSGVANAVTKDGTETISGQKTFSSNHTYFTGGLDIEGNVILKNNATLDNSTANTLKIRGSNTILLHEGSTTKNGLEVGTSSISPYLANPSYNLGYSGRPFANLYLGSSGKIYKGSNTLTLPSSEGTLALTTDIPDVSGKADKTEIPDISNLATKDEIPTNYVTTDTWQNITVNKDLTGTLTLHNRDTSITATYKTPIGQTGDKVYINRTNETDSSDKANVVVIDLTNKTASIGDVRVTTVTDANNISMKPSNSFQQVSIKSYLTANTTVFTASSNGFATIRGNYTGNCSYYLLTSSGKKSFYQRISTGSSPFWAMKNGDSIVLETDNPTISWADLYFVKATTIS